MKNDGELKFGTNIDTSGVKTGLSTLKSIFKTGVAVMVAKQAADIAKMGISYNAQMEQYQTSFEVMLGSADKASKHVAELKKMAEKTPFEMEDLAQASQQLQAFGVDVTEIRPDLKMLGDISLGNKERFKGLALVFGQVKSQGKLMGQDLLQMINQGFNPLQVISEKTGESMMSLKDRMSKGQISYEEVADAMKSATSEGGKFYQGMEKQSQTMIGKISTLKDNVKSLLGKLTDPAFNFISENILPKVMNGIEWMLNHLPIVEAAIAAVGSAISIGFAINKFSKIASAITKIGGAVKTFVVANPWLLLGAAISAVVIALVTYVKAGGDVSKLAQNISDKILEFTQKLPDIIAAIVDRVPEIITNIIQAITDNLPSIIQAGVTILITLIKGIISSIPQIIAAIPVVIEAILQAIIANLPTIISGGIKIIIAIITGLLKALPQLEKSIPKIIKAIVKALAEGGPQIIRVGTDLLKLLWQGIKNWSGNLFSNVIGIARALPNRIKSGIGSLFNIGANWLRGLWHGIASVKDWIISKVAGIGHSITSTIKGVFKINSPSKVMMEIGAGVGEGLGLGIEDETDNVVSKAKKQAEDVLDVYDPKNGFEINQKGIFAGALKDLSPAALNYSSLERNKAFNSTNEIHQTINITQPVKTPAETARALRKEAVTLGLAGGIV